MRRTQGQRACGDAFDDVRLRGYRCGSAGCVEHGARRWPARRPRAARAMPAACPLRPRRRSRCGRHGSTRRPARGARWPLLSRTCRAWQHVGRKHGVEVARRARCSGWVTLASSSPFSTGAEHLGDGVRGVAHTEQPAHRSAASPGASASMSGMKARLRVASASAALDGLRRGHAERGEISADVTWPGVTPCTSRARRAVRAPGPAAARGWAACARRCSSGSPP